ncbi:hypothetical protein ACYBT0_21120, partial [Klebsiella pneumoniae]|uniref:hypothetical protein n=1 Tax=Klebsiella pneumoniae TaxID=573 RepID=UPI001C053057
QRRRAISENGTFLGVAPLFRYCTRMSAGWRLSPYPAYERVQYQTVMRLFVGPRKRSAVGQSQKMAPF